MSIRNMKLVAAFLGLVIATAAMALTVNGELKKALLEKLAADPTAYEGRVYYNTVSQKARIYDGSSWSDIGGATSSLNQYLMEVGNASNSRATFNSSLLGDAQASSVSATATITIASPGVVTITGHGLTTGKKIYFTTTGALPTGLTASTTYYVIFVDANTFRLATSMSNAIAGTAVNTSGSQSGIHTAFYGGISLATSFTGAKTLTDSLTLGDDSRASTLSLNMRTGSSQRPEINLFQNGTARTTIATANAVNDVITGATAGDTTIRMNNKALLFSGDDGITRHASMSATGILTFSAQTYVQAYRNTSTQSITTSTFTAIDWNAEVVDRNGDFDLTANTFTAPTDGLYSISASIQFSGSSITRAIITALVNGNRYTLQDLQGVTTAAGNVTGSFVIPMSASQTAAIEIFLVGSSLAVQNGQTATWVTIYKAG